MTRKPTIGMLMAVPPAWSETFLQQTYHRLEEAGFQVVIFVLDKQGHTGKRLVEAYPRRFKRSIISASVSFLLTYLANRKRVAAYKKSLSVEGIHGREATKKIIQNLHILSADIDVLHAAFATQALGKECLGSAMGIPLTTSFRGFDVDVYPMKNPKAYDLLWKKLAGVHSISIYLVKKAHALGLPASVPVAVIPPAPEPVPFVERAFPSNNMNLLFVGRLHWIKGLTYLLDAIALLKKKSIPLSLTVVGEGEEAEALVFQAHQLDISDCVYFAGKMKRNDLLVAYAAHDYYIQPSLSEGFCNAVLEAQQAGMIVMAADAGALSENIVNNETGFLFPASNPMAMAECMERVWHKSVEEKQQIAEHASTRAHESFSAEKQKRELEKFFRSVISA